MKKTLIFLLLTSCVSILDTDIWKESEWETVTIQRGHHQQITLNDFVALETDTLKYKAVFRNVLYHFGNTHDLDINKLPGLSNLPFNHSKYSNLLGWRCNELEIEIVNFVNGDKIRQKENSFTGNYFAWNYIKTIRQGDTLDVKMWANDTAWCLNLDGVLYTEPSDKNTNTYITDFFFGGKKTAPHDMVFRVKYER